MELYGIRICTYLDDAFATFTFAFVFAPHMPMEVLQYFYML